MYSNAIFLYGVNPLAGVETVSQAGMVEVEVEVEVGGDGKGGRWS